MSKENWSNKEEIELRTKIALKVLLLMFKILSPYRFEHCFKEDLESLDKEIHSL